MKTELERTRLALDRAEMWVEFLQVQSRRYLDSLSEEERKNAPTVLHCAANVDALAEPDAR